MSWPVYNPRESDTKKWPILVSVRKYFGKEKLAYPVSIIVGCFHGTFSVDKEEYMYMCVFPKLHMMLGNKLTGIAWTEPFSMIRQKQLRAQSYHLMWGTHDIFSLENKTNNKA